VSAYDALLARAAQEVDAGRLPSCQLALAHSGRLLATAGFGADDTTRYVVFSVTKAITAGAAWVAIGAGLMGAQTRVVDVVPEFGTNGKDAVTLEHLLTHTAGFPRAPMRPEDGATRDGRLRRFAQWRLDTPPGERTEYHPTSAHWVVAEMLERVTGSTYLSGVADLLEPLGVRDLRLGVPVGEQSGIAPIEMVDAGAELRPGTPEIATADQLLRFNEPAVRAIGVPGAGAIGTASAVALYYQALLRDPAGVWQPDVLADGTGHIRNRLPDAYVNVPANRTLGLVVAGDDGQAWLRQFGRGTGPRAFGAAGIGGQIAWADPDSGLSFCYLTNGLEADPVVSFIRSADISTLAAACVPGA
jgi:CubicO group peptidase (beta-lactamase class C family)